MIKKLLLTSVIFIYNGCNSSSSSTSSSNSLIKAYLVDSNVSGVEYYCNDDIQGITDKNGAFYFDYSCNTIEFRIGTITLASMDTKYIKKDNIFYLTDITQQPTRSDTNNTSVKNIARLLQSLDDDYNPSNGINITEQTRENITKTIPFNISNENINDVDLKNILLDANINNELISELRALVHVEQTLRDNNISVDTVPPYKPYLTTNIISTSNDLTYIDLNGEKNSKIFINNIYTNKNLSQNGTYSNFELNTSGYKNLFYDFNITLKDNTNKTSPTLSLSIFKDTDDLNPYTFPSIVNVSSPSKEVLDINITDNSQDYGLLLNYNLSGVDAQYFDINNSNGKLTLKNDSISGKQYNLNISVSDQSNHKRSADIIVKIQ